MDIPETFSQRTVGSGSLINISVARKEVEGTLGKVACQQIVWHLLEIERLERQGGCCVWQEIVSPLLFPRCSLIDLQGVKPASKDKDGLGR